MQDWDRYSGKDVILLQGPVGPYFSRLRERLEGHGVRVHKINFNGGDWLFYRHGARNYLGGAAGWPAWFEDYLDRTGAVAVFLFGDCRPMHRQAIEIATRRGIAVGVFEEGYIRSNYITMEFGGVNGFSSMPRDPAFYRAQPTPTPREEVQIERTFGFAALWAMIYYLAATLLKPVFIRYRHHRPLHIFDGLHWIRSYWRKNVYQRAEQDIMPRLTGDLSHRFFLVPLQVSTDAQIRVHSNFADVDTFLAHVVNSFARCAPKDVVLVVKHHPMDRGYRDYSRLIESLRQKFGLDARLLYIHDQHLPTLLDHARGVVTVNSTVGFSALVHQVPVKVCGVALYDMEGLTWQGQLDDFWKAAPDFHVDRDLFNAFREQLIERTQINDSFYRPLPVSSPYHSSMKRPPDANPVPNSIKELPAP